MSASVQLRKTIISEKGEEGLVRAERDVLNFAAAFDVPVSWRTLCRIQSSPSYSGAGC